MRLFLMTAATLFASQACAETAVPNGQMRAIYDGDGQHRYACFDVRNGAGQNATIMIMMLTEKTVKGEKKVARTYGGMASSGKCVAVKGYDRVVIEGSAIGEPVSVRVRSSRLALKKQ